MIKTYQEELILKSCNCDFTGHWRPSDILVTMQEIAGIHAELLGVGRYALIEKNAVWVLTRTQLQMDKYPGVGDRVIIETFPMNNRRVFFPRYFIFKDDHGHILGTAATLWVLLDITTRHMLPPDLIKGLMPDNSDLPAPMGLPGIVEDVDGGEMVLERMPAYTDLDVNQHVNNTKYADWLCDMLGIDLMREKCLHTLIVNYANEILPGQQMKLHLKRHENAYILTGYHNDQRHFEIGGLLMDRPKETKVY